MKSLGYLSISIKLKNGWSLLSDFGEENGGVTTRRKFRNIGFVSTDQRLVIFLHSVHVMVFSPSDNFLWPWYDRIEVMKPVSMRTLGRFFTFNLSIRTPASNAWTCKNPPTKGQWAQTRPEIQYHNIILASGPYKYAVHPSYGFVWCYYIRESRSIRFYRFSKTLV